MCHCPTLVDERSFLVDGMTAFWRAFPHAQGFGGFVVENALEDGMVKAIGRTEECVHAPKHLVSWSDGPAVEPKQWMWHDLPGAKIVEQLGLEDACGPMTNNYTSGWLSTRGVEKCLAGIATAASFKWFLGSQVCHPNHQVTAKVLLMRGVED